MSITSTIDRDVAASRDSIALMRERFTRQKALAERHSAEFALRQYDVFAKAMCGGLRHTDVHDAMAAVGLQGYRREAIFQLDFSPSNLRRIKNTLDPNVGSAGGFAMPTLQDAIVQKSVRVNPWLDVATVDNAQNSMEVKVPILDATGCEAVFVDNDGNTTDTNTEPVFEAKILRPFKTRETWIIPEELANNAPDFIDGITTWIVEPLHRAFGRQFTAGQAPKHPLGILYAATVGHTAASATAITFDELLDLWFSVDEEHRAGGRGAMMMHPLIWKHFSKLKDGSGNYLWNNCPALRDVQVIENKWMPSTLSAGTRAVLAGDFRRAVRIKNFGLRIYTTTENTVENGQMKVIGFQEMDVALVDNGALKALQTAAS